MKNAFLYNKLKEYGENALAILNRGVKDSKDLPIIINEKFEINGNGGISSYYTRDILWHKLVGRNEQSLKQLKV